jgi:hypothetical protein
VCVCVGGCVWGGRGGVGGQLFLAAGAGVAGGASDHFSDETP